MNRNPIGSIFSTLSRALMTMTLCGAVYLVRTLVRMHEYPASALQLYHSFPELAEHITAGILFYVLFALLFMKTASSGEPSV